MINFIRKYLGNIYIPLIWTLTIIILLTLPGQMLPSEQKFSIPQFDKFVHISMFGGFVFLWNLYLSRRYTAIKKLLGLFFFIFILGDALGIGMEFVQKYFIPNRDFDLADIIADMIGAGIAYGLSTILLLTDPV